MDAVITKSWALKAVLHGACEIPRVGAKIADLSTSDLCWVEDAGFITDAEKNKITDLPIWVISGSGSGYGYGYGDGDGSGYGDGSGDGYGYGDGSGDGSGYGYGSGSGDGSGDGSGSGSGSGDGSGLLAEFLDKYQDG